MKAFAAVMTGKGAAAIATVCLIGERSAAILQNIFKPLGKTAVQFETGKILHGHIVDGENIIDEVVVGCEVENEFAINCHGNPLIVEMIMELLVKNGVEAVSAEQFLELHFKANTAIALEAKLAQLKSKTIEGCKLLQNQIEGALTQKVAEWIKTESPAQIQNEATEILKVSHAAHYIVHGCKVVLAGPANSGKSTLLNYLSGRDKSIVADIPGTTRDWVSATCISGPLAMEMFDTAGLDESLTLGNAIDKEAQKRSIKLLQKADVVIWVIDGTKEISNFKFQISNIPAIIAINKSDLGLKTGGIPKDAVVISAKNGDGIDELTKSIRTILDVEGFDLKQAICFTDRQRRLLEQLSKIKNKLAATSVITELLNGSVCV